MKHRDPPSEFEEAMRHSPRPTAHPLLLALFAASACSDPVEPGDGPDPVDAGPSAPDARVLPPRDAGESTGPAPTLTRVTPATGSVEGGTRVTLRGTAFEEPIEVWFGAERAPSVAQLDAQTVAATTPPGSLGPVSVRVGTASGVAELPNAFTYVRELRLDAVEPRRLPDVGGEPVTVRGRGFTAETVVLFDRRPLRGQVVVDDTSITGWSPALSVGRPEVRIVTRDAAVRRSDVAVVYGSLDMQAVLPGYGPAAGGAEQTLGGSGLLDASAVLFGGQAGDAVDVRGDDRIAVRAPRLPVGVHDVAVENADTRTVLAGAYVAFDPARTDLHVLAAVPRQVPLGAETTVTLVGGGFLPGTQVALGGRRLTLARIDARAIEVRLPGDLPLGENRLEVLRGNASASASVFVVSGPRVDGIDPSSGPASGGTEVRITGSGFVPGGEVRIADVRLEDVTVVSDTEIRGRTVAGSHGPSDVVFRAGASRATLPGAFTFVEPFEIVRVEPTEGSAAGNTYVTVIGRGLGAPVSVAFGPAAGVDPRLENGSVLGVRSPPGPPGTVDLEILTGAGNETLPAAFSYFDPRLLGGGAWGGPIDGAVNVAVVNNEGLPLAGMTVQLGYDADPRYRRVTDANGLATISSPEIRGSQTVTAGGPDTEFVTFTDIDARNLTFISAPHPQPPPPDAPLNPCPTGAAAPVVRGRVFGLKSAIDPNTSPGVIPLVRVTYTQANVFAANPPMPPEQFDQVFEEGEAFEIVVMRAGTVAVYAIMGDFDTATQQFTPRRLGIARGVPVAPEQVTENVDITLDIEMNQTLRIRLDAPPPQNPGPTLNAVFPFLNLASDGVIPFAASLVQAPAEVILENMPALAESAFFYMGGSFTQGQNGGLASPYSLTLLESNASFADGVDLGPYLEMPTNVRPKPFDLAPGGRFTWDQGGLTPDLARIDVVDSRTISGCCCVDINMNGQCDEGEPPQCGGGPVQFNRWSVFGPGGRQSYALPLMPLDVQAFEPPGTYNYLVQLAIAPRFSWQEFAYNQFSPFFWRSWVVWSSAFAAKEETD